MNLYLDTEFTGLHQYTTLISLALTTDDERIFYAEFTDYDHTQVDDWVADNVLKNLFLPMLREYENGFIQEEGFPLRLNVKGNTAFVSPILRTWLKSLHEPIHIWADCHAYDWVLFRELLDNDLPDNVFYLPYDLHMLFVCQGKDPNVNRAEFAGVSDVVKHNALDDALVIQHCVRKLCCEIAGLEDS